MGHEAEETVMERAFAAKFRAEDGEWHTCLKQVTRCDITVWGNIVVSATNACHVGDATVCPRVTANCVSGEGYELCGPPKHAEQEAAAAFLAMFPEGVSDDVTPIAHLYGHTYLCMECQHALVAAGITRFVITGEPA